MEYQHRKSENQIGFNLEDAYLLMAFMAFKDTMRYLGIWDF